MIAPNRSELPYKVFQQFSTILLAGITGVLILLPLGMSHSPEYLHWFALLGFSAGTLVGYRRRESRMFFYYCLAAVVMLSCLLTLAFR